MTYKDRDVIYILTREDVDHVARELIMRKPTEEQYRVVRKYIEDFYGQGDHNWHDAIADALSEAAGQLNGKSPALKR